MAKLHGLIYIAVGLLVLILSWKLNYEKLIFFFYSGLVFIFFGMVKLALNFIKRKGHNTESLPKNLQHQAKGQYPIHKFKYCHECGNHINPHDRFCSKCGVRIQ